MRCIMLKVHFSHYIMLQPQILVFFTWQTIVELYCEVEGKSHSWNKTWKILSALCHNRQQASEWRCFSQMSPKLNYLGYMQTPIDSRNLHIIPSVRRGDSSIMLWGCASFIRDREAAQSWWTKLNAVLGQNLREGNILKVEQKFNFQ